MESLPSASGDAPTFIAIPNGEGPWPGVVVLHDAGEMTQYVREHATWLGNPADAFPASHDHCARGTRRIERVLQRGSP